ncbi:MAG: flagellar hook capping FlgD N-terminal domain-containing protein [Pacificimonas sp.]
MDISAITPAAEQSATAKLTADFDMFLRLLTTQLQNQDPLDPMDSSEYTQQLVSYSQVEQAIQQTGKLDAILGALAASDLTGASNLIGREVGNYTSEQIATADGADWAYDLSALAALTQLTVTDSLGRIVHSETGQTSAGRHAFRWTGGTEGETYSLSVQALSAAGNAVDSRTLATGRVTGVEALAGDIMLDVGGRFIRAADVATISDTKGA